MDPAWGNYFSAQVGGSATLLGLLFVGVSLNLSQILETKGLANRSLLALMLLLMVMLLALVFLMPNVTAFGLAIVITGAGLAMLAGGTAIEISLMKVAQTAPSAYLPNLLLFEAAAITYVVGGAFLFFGDFSGVTWVAVAMILSTLKATIDAWVLLVEIKR